MFDLVSKFKPSPKTKRPVNAQYIYKPLIQIRLSVLQRSPCHRYAESVATAGGVCAHQAEHQMRHAQQNLQWATDEDQGQNRAGDAAQHKGRRPVQGFACLLFQILRGVVIQQYQHARYHQENQTGQPHHRGDVALVFGHFTIQGLRSGIGRLGLRLVAAAT